MKRPVKLLIVTLQAEISVKANYTKQSILDGVYFYFFFYIFETAAAITEKVDTYSYFICCSLIHAVDVHLL